MATLKECCTIGITSYGRLHYTKECLESLHKHKNKYPFKIVVVNNFHPTENDECEVWLKEQYNLGNIDALCLMTKNVGISKGCNAAWTKYPDNKYFLKLDNDMFVKVDGWLDDMIEFANKYPKFGTFGYNVEPVSYPLAPNGLRVKEGNIGGACVLISKYVEGIVGYYNELFGNPYSEEDADLNIRLAFRGLKNAYMPNEDAFWHAPSGKAGVIDQTQPGFKVGGMEAELETEYRAWKDSFREKTVPLLYQQIEKYRMNIMNTYCKTNAAVDFKRKWYKGEK